MVAVFAVPPGRIQLLFWAINLFMVILANRSHCTARTACVALEPFLSLL